MVDYYSVLELSPTANTDEVVKAYSRLASKWHPNQNSDRKEEAKQKFKDISEAYEILSDKNKRNLYDQYGKEFLAFDSGSATGNDIKFDQDTSASFENPFRDPEDVFKEFFRKDPSDDLEPVDTSLKDEDPGMNVTSTSTQSLHRRVETEKGNGAKTVTVNETSISTRIADGVRTETRKVVENGVETVTVLENGVIKSKTVDGVDQSLKES